MSTGYELDAPPVVRNPTLAGLIGTAARLALYLLFVITQTTLATVLLIGGLVSDDRFLVAVASYLMFPPVRVVRGTKPA